MSFQDRTGRHTLWVGVNVKITHPRASYAGERGKVVSIVGARVIVQLDGTDICCNLGHRSVEIVPSR
jgi:hypothetical protein